MIKLRAVHVGKHGSPRLGIVVTGASPRKMHGLRHAPNSEGKSRRNMCSHSSLERVAAYKRRDTRPRRATSRAGRLRRIMGQTLRMGSCSPAPLAAAANAAGLALLAAVG